MKDEEMAEEYSQKICGYVRVELAQAFLAGLKAGKQKWHKVADGDLPKYGYQVLSEKGALVIYNRDINSWFEYSPNADNIKLRKWEEPIAWCEIPKFEEE